MPTQHCDNNMVFSYPPFIKGMRVYAMITLSYGLVRSVSYDYNGKKEYHNRKTKEYVIKDMLLTDKIGRITGSAAAAMIVWPSMLGEDLARLECKVRGKDIEEYDLGWNKRM